MSARWAPAEMRAPSGPVATMATPPRCTQSGPSAGRRRRQRDPEVLGGRVPLGRIGGQRPHGGLDQRRREVGRGLGQRCRRLVHVPVQQRDRVPVVHERQAAAEQLVEHGGQRVHVGGRGELLAERLLGSHVRGRTEHLARAGGHRRGAADHLGDPEVGHLDGPGRGEQDVVGLDVAVEDPLAVGVVQRAAGGGDDAARGLGGDALAVEALPHRAPGQQLHDEQAEAGVLHVVVDGDDVRMIQVRQHPRLAHEPVLHSRIGGERDGQLLDGHVPPELSVATAQHDPPRAPAELVADLVVGQRAGDLVAVEGHERRPVHVGSRPGEWMPTRGPAVTPRP